MTKSPDEPVIAASSPTSASIAPSASSFPGSSTALLSGGLGSSPRDLSGKDLSGINIAASPLAGGKIETRDPSTGSFSAGTVVPSGAVSGGTVASVTFGGTAGGTASISGSGLPPDAHNPDDKFWRDLFLTEPPRLDRLYEYSRRSVPEYFRAEEQLPIHPTLANRLNQWCAREGVARETALAAAWLILAARATEETDIALGIVLPGRSDQLLPIRVSVDSMPVRTFLVTLARTLEDPEAVPGIRWQWFLSQVWLKHSSVRPLPFQIAAILAPLPEPAPALNALLRKSDAALIVRRTEDSLSLAIDYDVEVFTAHGISTRLGQLERILRAMCDDPDCDLTLLNFAAREDEEAYRLINRTEKSYPTGETIDDLFVHQARLSGDKPAVIFRDQVLTFSKLEQDSSRLAAEIRLRSKNSIVGIHLDRSPETIVSALAAIRAGAAYLPLDPAYPEDRLRFMMEDSGTQLLLTREKAGWADSCEQIAVDASYLDSLHGSVEPRLSSPSSPFCVMYTSGSTGRPKGVVNIHYATLNCFYWMWEEFPFKDGEMCCQTASLSFGDSIQEVFGPLLKGVPLLMLPLDVLRNPRALLDLLSAKRITRLTLVPSLLERLLDVTENLGDALPYLRLWITSGEALPRSLAERFLEAHPGARLINLYGASELSNDVTFQEVRKDQVERSVRVRIGRPIPNMRNYVVDEKLRICPVGIPGELWVSGRGLSPGYQSHPELTAEKFRDNPFPYGEPVHEDHRRVYRTGDKVCLRADGELEYIGRMDSQVKIAGKRIELEEVEAVLDQHPDVNRAVVSLHVSPFGIRQIVAYLVAKPGAVLTPEALGEHSRSLLPDYMVPAIWEMVDALPLTPSGKIDRRSLPPPAWHTAERTEQPAEDGALDSDESAIAALWREVLDFSGPLRPEQSFFDAGGTSLAMMLLIVKIEKRFQLLLGSKTIFSNPTLEGMADSLRAAREEASSGGPRALALSGI